MSAAFAQYTGATITPDGNTPLLFFAGCLDGNTLCTTNSEATAETLCTSVTNCSAFSCTPAAAAPITCSLFGGAVTVSPLAGGNVYVSRAVTPTVLAGVTGPVNPVTTTTTTTTTTTSTSTPTLAPIGSSLNGDNQSNGLGWGPIVGIAIGSVIVLFTLIGLVMWYKRRHLKQVKLEVRDETKKTEERMQLVPVPTQMDAPPAVHSNSQLVVDAQGSVMYQTVSPQVGHTVAPQMGHTVPLSSLPVYQTNVHPMMPVNEGIARKPVVVNVAPQAVQIIQEDEHQLPRLPSKH